LAKAAASSLKLAALTSRVTSSRDAHDLLLVLDQPQAHLLLGDLCVALDGLGLAFGLLVAQVPEGRNDRRQEQQHRGQRPQRHEAVLARRRLAPPPASQQAALAAHGGQTVGCGVGRTHGHDYPGPPTGPPARRRRKPLEMPQCENERHDLKTESACATLPAVCNPP